MISWASALEGTVSAGNQTGTFRNVPRKQTLDLERLDSLVGLENLLEIPMGIESKRSISDGIHAGAGKEDPVRNSTVPITYASRTVVARVQAA